MYSPKIKEEIVRELYKYKKRYPLRKPMTFFVNEAMVEYLGRKNKNVKCGKSDIGVSRLRADSSVDGFYGTNSRQER
jgi:hypothetical protein